ncbi:hypothetical protein MKW92_024558 [Papaver armeniacum]|nr:hypothetical protein MKW92_024558 [Papaver armeniacum]
MAQSIELQNSVIEQRIVIRNKYGENLVGILHETGSSEIIILCHGFASNKESPINLNVAEALTKEGISIFRFDFSGNGYGTDDLYSVVLYFSRMKRVIGGILGHSKGGVVVLVYASKYHDVPMVINVSGRYKMDRGIEEHLGKDFMERIKENGFIDVKDEKGNIWYRATEESLSERLATDMHALCLAIAEDCRVFTVHGSEDECIPVEDAFEFAKIIHNHQLHIVEGADHCYNNHQSELVEVVVNFIRGIS